MKKEEVIISTSNPWNKFLLGVSQGVMGVTNFQMIRVLVSTFYDNTRRVRRVDNKILERLFNLKCSEINTCS